MSAFFGVFQIFFDEGGEIAARKQQALDAGGPRRLHIDVLVADKHAARRIDRPMLHQIKDHAGLGLAPIRLLAIGGNLSVGEEWAVAHVVDARALSRKFAAHPGIERIHLRLGELAARHAGLVGGDEHEIVGVIKFADGRCRAVHPAEALARADITVVDIDDAVAVEQRSRLPHGLSTVRTAVSTRATETSAVFMWRTASLPSLRARSRASRSPGGSRIAATGLSGFQCHGLVGPKIATVGVPIAAETCIRPESLVTATSAAAIARMALRRSGPVRSRVRPRAACTMSLAIWVSFGPPSTQTAAPSLTSARANLL